MSKRIDLAEVVAHFGTLEDPRSSVDLRHPPPSVLVISLLTVLAGAEEKSNEISTINCNLQRTATRMKSAINPRRSPRARKNNSGSQSPNKQSQTNKTS